ncbi:MAG: 5-formyltetrahydrofolate cyclo-ligase [Pseudomonadota bacterium]|nr:5-formyltetrahydrofolate cyclo-ligase [Pseudomonadota bacterium]
MTANYREKLRSSIKAERSNLSRENSRALSNQITKKLWRSGIINNVTNLGIYLAIGGEVNCSNIITEANLRKISIFVPVLWSQKLMFAPLNKDTKFVLNRYGISEPSLPNCKKKQAKSLDAVIVPTLGFDKHTNRIGMGGGYYDRSFSFRKRRKIWKKPLLIGLAYSFQQLKHIPIEDWDVPLDIVVTEQEILENC